MNARLELQKSIYRELDSEKYKVFTELKLNEPYPYIRIDAVNKNTYETKTTKGYQFSVFINSFSDSTSTAEVAELSNFVEFKLTNKFDIEGFYNVKQDLTNETSSYSVEDGTEIKQINQEFNFIIIRKEEF